MSLSPKSGRPPGSFTPLEQMFWAPLPSSSSCFVHNNPAPPLRGCRLECKPGYYLFRDVRIMMFARGARSEERRMLPHVLRGGYNRLP